jgi:hypothetical protein
MDRAIIGDLYRAESERMLVYFARRMHDAQLALDLVAEVERRVGRSWLPWSNTSPLASEARNGPGRS